MQNFSKSFKKQGRYFAWPVVPEMTALWAILFISPAFANTRWPWELNPFDSRIMSAWLAGIAVWSATMYFMMDWAEVKMGVRAILLFLLGLLAAWLVGASRYVLNTTAIAGRQTLVYGVSLGVMLAWLSCAYWKQEQARRTVKIVSRTADEVQVPLS